MRTTLRTSLAVGLAWAMLVASINLGLAVPGLQFLRGFGAEGALDYSHRSGFFTPLTRGFVGRILGLASDDPGSSNSDRLTSDRSSAARRGRTEGVAHPFTNDDFESAYEVKSLPFRAETNTTGAKRQANEPADCSPSGGTAWYRYRPANDEALFADTFGTSRATALGVYSGSRPGALRLIGCDANILGNAQVGFRAVADTTYYFQVSGVIGGGPTLFELAAVGSTTVETLSPGREPADASAFDRPEISSDGRFATFMSYAKNLSSSPPRCGNEGYCTGLYLRDRLSGTTSLIAAQGTPYPPDGDSSIPLSPSLSADSRYLGFSAYTFLPLGGLEGYRGPSEADQPAFNTYLYDRVTGNLELVSRNSAGEPARGHPVVNEAPIVRGHYIPTVSADGRYVLFNSDGANLGNAVEPRGKHVYRRDRVTGVTRLVSTDPSGAPLPGNSCAGTGRNMSGDGRYVAFVNIRDPLSYRPEQSQYQGEVVYLWDANTGRSRMVARNSYCPSISYDGSVVGLVSFDPLVPEDTNGTPDVYVYEVDTRRFQRVSVNSAGEQSYDPNFAGRERGTLGRAVTLSADGRFAVFDSAAPDLAPSAVGSTRHQPGVVQVFLHDRLTRATVLVSVSSTGEPLPGDSHMPYISHDGRTVSFMSISPSGLTNVLVHELSILR